MSAADNEEFWAGSFGNEYNARNVNMHERNLVFFSRALAGNRYPIKSVLEFGCGTGYNLWALKCLATNAETFGIEINKEAAVAAATRADHVFNLPAISWPRAEGQLFDLVLSKGFLIHIPEVDLPRMLDKMYEAARRYILIAEYYNPMRVEVPYRGRTGVLWKDDFATRMIGQHPSLHVVDYGFTWRHAYPWPQDDITWFLLEKRQ